MTKTNMDLSELLAKHDQGDLLRSIAEAVLQLMMEADVDGLIGAGRHERADGRTTWRNGHRDLNQTGFTGEQKARKVSYDQRKRREPFFD